MKKKLLKNNYKCRLQGGKKCYCGYPDFPCYLEEREKMNKYEHLRQSEPTNQWKLMTPDQKYEVMITLLEDKSVDYVPFWLRKYAVDTLHQLFYSRSA